MTDHRDDDFDAHRVLADASDDDGRPYDYAIGTVIRRGRRRVLIRNTTGAAVSAVAVGAVAVAATQIGGSGRASSDDAPVASSSPSSTQVSSASVSTPARKRIVPLVPLAKMSDKQIIRRCKVADEVFLRVSSNKAGGGTDPFDDWSVVLKEAPKGLVHAILLSPDGKRYAYCTLDPGGDKTLDQSVRQSVAVSVRNYEVFTAGWGAAAEPVPANVARMTFETSDAVYQARVKDGFVLWANPNNWNAKPLWANFYDASGKRIARFNTNPPVKTPVAR